MNTLVQQLAAHATAIEGDALPGAIQERIRCFLLYNLSMALAGYDADDLTWRAISSLPTAPGRSMQLATGWTMAPQDAAFSNAALITARGQNDTSRDVYGHLGCVVLPAVLALGQDRGAAMDDVMAAVAAGYEVEAQLARGASAKVVKRGFRATAVFGPLGAAAGAARVIGLDATRTAHALALATNFAAGTMQCWSEGTMEWRLQVAQASRAGVLSALLAEQGVAGASQALEGAAGFYRAFSGDTAPPLVIDGWAMRDVLFKPYPGCAINQGPVFALLSLLERHGAPLVAADIDRIDVHLSPDQSAYPGVANAGPFATPSGAVMSTAFMLTAALRDRALYQRHFSGEYASEALNAQSRFVKVVPDPQTASGSTRLVVHLRDGTSLQAHCVDVEQFIFDWERTVRLVLSLAPEVQASDGSAIIARLVAAIGELEQHALGAVLETCRLTV